VKMTSSPTATSSSMRCRPCPARPGRRPGRGRAAASSSPRQDDAALHRVLFLEDLDKQAITKRLQIRVSLPERVFLSVSHGWACLAPLTSSARVGTGTPFVGAAVPGARRLFSLPRHSAPCRCPRSGAALHTCDAPNLSACDGEPDTGPSQCTQASGVSRRGRFGASAASALGLCAFQAYHNLC
jgi:hypothetical protein